MKPALEPPAAVGRFDTAERERIEQLLHDRSWRLSFGGRIEASFRQHNDAEATAVFRTNLVYLFFLYVAMASIALFFGDYDDLGIWPITISGFGVVILVAFGLSFTSLFAQYYQRVIAALASLVVALAVINPTLMDEYSFRMLIYIGTVYAILIIYLGLGLRLPYASLAALAGGMPVVIWLVVRGAGVEWDMLIASYLGSSAVCAYLCYRDEHLRRRMFLQALLLHTDRERMGKLANELEQLSMVDSLTGLANRRHFDEVLTREWGRCKREQKSIALVFLDVDKFKPYNDYYGHQRGDDCLRQLARVFSNGARRPSDLAVRYGGEEFIVLLPETGELAARQIAEALVRDVAAQGLPHATSDVSNVVTVSAGVAVLIPEEGVNNQTQLIELADEALYRAKQEGRNCVRVAEPPV